MLKSELIAALNGIDGDFEIFISRDPEGNGYNPIDEVSENNAADEETRRVGLHHLNEGLIESGYTDEDVVKGRQVIVLWAGYPHYSL